MHFQQFPISINKCYVVYVSEMGLLHFYCARSSACYKQVILK